MYSVNSSVPKTLIKHLVRWAAENVFDEKAGKGRRSAKEILLDVIDTPISPELKPADSDGNIKQKTEDLIGPYELHDFFLYIFLRKTGIQRRIRRCRNPEMAQEVLLEILQPAVQALLPA